MANAKTQRLVIVESPAKAKTISGYLGPGYVVEASYGHVRDLPRNAADVPAKHKGQAWARLGVDVDHDFAGRGSGVIDLVECGGQLVPYVLPSQHLRFPSVFS